VHIKAHSLPKREPFPEAHVEPLNQPYWSAIFVTDGHTNVYTDGVADGVAEFVPHTGTHLGTH
jgi:hypothetical protein